MTDVVSTPRRERADEPVIERFELPHLRVSALTWGPADGRLVLCLHGFPDTAWTWRFLGPALAARGYRVVAPFSRGYAPTEIPRDGDYHIGALMHDAMALHRHLRGGDDAILIGHDWGGFTAVALAAHQGSPFAKIVVLGTPVIGGLTGHRGVGLLRRLPAQARKSWYVLYNQLPGLPERTAEKVIPRLWRDWCPPGFDASAELEHLWAALPDREHRRAAINYYRHQFQPRHQHPAYRSLHYTWRREQLLSPILLLHGQIDGGLDAALATESAQRLPAGSRHHVIEDAGHFIHLDQPALVHELIGDYLTTP